MIDVISKLTFAPFSIKTFGEPIIKHLRLLLTKQAITLQKHCRDTGTRVEHKYSVLLGTVHETSSIAL